MKTYPLHRDDGTLYGFEIPSSWTTFGPLFKILRSVDGVSDVRRQYFKDDRIVFDYHGEKFVVNEPWGDSSRYWVGSEKGHVTKQAIEPIHEAFDKYETLFQSLLRNVFK